MISLRPQNKRMGRVTLRTGLLLTSAGVAASAAALLGNGALFCRRHGCPHAPPFLSQVASSGPRESQNLEILLVQALFFQLAVAVALRNAAGQASDAQLLYILLAQPVILAALVYDRLRHRKLHLLLFYASLALLTCELGNSWLPLLPLLPAAYLIVFRNLGEDSSNADGTPKVDGNRRFGPMAQYVALVVYVAVALALNVRALRALPVVLRQGSLPVALTPSLPAPGR